MERRDVEAGDGAAVAERPLVEAARSGDRDAFRRLYQQDVGVVVRYVAARVPSAEVEDVTAEVFVRAWARMPQYEWRGLRFRSWLWGGRGRWL